MFFLDVKHEEALRSKWEERKIELKLVKGWHIIKTEESVEEVQKRIDEILDKLDGENKKSYIICLLYCNEG